MSRLLLIGSRLAESVIGSIIEGVNQVCMLTLTCNVLLVQNTSLPNSLYHSVYQVIL